MIFKDVLLCDIEHPKPGQRLYEYENLKIKYNKDAAYALFKTFDKMKPIGEVSNVRTDEGKMYGDVKLTDEQFIDGLVAPAFKGDRISYKEPKEAIVVNEIELMYFGLVMDHAHEGMKPLNEYKEEE